MSFIRAALCATVLLALNGFAQAQSYSQMQWGINRAATPSAICVMSAGTCIGQIGTFNLSNGVFTPAIPNGTITSAMFVSGAVLLPSNNLSDLISASAARTNLGLGSLAVLSALPAPTASVLGGVKATSCASTNFANGIGTDGTITCAIPAGGGGGGSPGGSAGQIQFNSAGSFAGFTVSGDATINTGTGALTIANAAVTSAKMATGAAVGNIANGAVTAAMLASGAAVSNIGYTPVNKAGDTMSGMLDLQPTQTTNKAALNVFMVPGGTWTNPWLNLLEVAQDNINFGTSSTSTLSHWQVSDFIGGSSMTGARTAVSLQTTMSAPTSASNGNRQYNTLGATFFANANDGGTNTGAGAQGAVGAANFITIANASATNLAVVGPLELNPSMQAGSSAKYKFGMAIALGYTDAVRGTLYDTAIGIGRIADSPSGSFKNGILFGPMHGVQPFSTDSTILASVGSSTVDSFIDFSSYAANSYYLKFANATLDGSGNFLGRTAFLTKSGSLSGGGLGATVVQTQANAGDTSDSAMAGSYTLSTASATNELVVRALNFNATNNLTGGGHLQNLRAFDMGLTFNAGTTTDMAATIFLEAGGAGTVNTAYGVLISSLVGTTKWGFYDNTLSQSFFSGGAITGFPVVVNSLPNCNSTYKGLHHFVTDATQTLTAGIGATVAGGSSNNVPVVCDGTNWKIGALDETRTNRRLAANDNGSARAERRAA